MQKIFRCALLAFFGAMTACMLCFPARSLALALEGLNLWFQRMIPALLPFMILSGLLIKTELSDRFAAFFSPVLGPLFRLSNACLYVIVIGFLCGFPMGARVCAESYQKGKLSRREATLLLAFCNNIGPVYVTGYVLTLFPAQRPALILGGMYGIPLLYGLLLRYTSFRELSSSAVGAPPASRRLSAGFVLSQLNASILSALDAITALGGYMIFCNLLNLIPQLFLTGIPRQLAGCLLEITSGLARLDEGCAFWAYTLLPLGGLSCIAQTYTCMRETDLSLREYLVHKALQTALSALYYGLLLIG